MIKSERGFMNYFVLAEEGVSAEIFPFFKFCLFLERRNGLLYILKLDEQKVG